MTTIEFDSKQLIEDLKEINQIAELIEAKKHLLSKYKIKFIATTSC